MPQKTHSLTQDPSHLATPFIGAQRPRGVSQLQVLPVVVADGDLDRLARLLERRGQSALAADLRSLSGKSSGASGGGRGSRPGGLAAGTAPERFGADRNSATVEKIEAEELYAVFDPVGLDSNGLSER